MKSNSYSSYLILAVLFCTAGFASISLGGWEQGRIAFQSISRSCVGCITLGSKYFWAGPGDAMDVDYDVEVHRGSLRLWIARVTPRNLGDVEASTETVSSGVGNWHAPISRLGWYHLVVYGNPGGNGYDLDYHVRWRLDRLNPWYATLADLLSSK